MGNLRLFFIVGSFLFFAFAVEQAKAEEKTLIAQFDRKDNGEVGKLYLFTGKSGDIVKLEVHVFEGQKRLTAKTVELRPKDLEGKGRAIYTQTGIDVIVLKSDTIERHNGGYIKIDYLYEYNTFKENDRREYEVELDRLGDEWRLLKNGDVFTQMTIHGYKWGIKKIDFK